MTEYPLPVRNWTGDQALTIICERCATERVIDADEITSEDIYECPADRERRRKAISPSRVCRGLACMKYMEADPCRGCGELGWFPDALDGCCSRKCQLQAEYAESLKGQAA